jgi:hypothetical protein
MLFRQLNQNLPLLGENTPLFQIFYKILYFSAFFGLFLNVGFKIRSNFSQIWTVFASLSL